MRHDLQNVVSSDWVHDKQVQGSAQFVNEGYVIDEDDADRTPPLIV